MHMQIDARLVEIAQGDVAALVGAAWATHRQAADLWTASIIRWAADLLTCSQLFRVDSAGCRAGKELCVRAGATHSGASHLLPTGHPPFERGG